MKDKFGHLRDEGEQKTEEDEFSAGEPRRDDQYSEKFQEAQEEMLDNIADASAVQRERELRRDTDIEDRQVASAITDVDFAITHELDKDFDFHVEQNNQQIKVPVIWDKQERWTWARQRRELKSVKDKVLLPLIVIDRSDVSKHPSHITRPTITQLNNTGNQVSVRQRYSRKNQYTRFRVLQNAQPEREFYITQVPYFLQASYDITVYTEYRWQMDEITDLIQYYTDDYWGDENTGRVFYTRVESVSEEVEMTDEARFVRSDISLSVDGYIIPKETRDNATGIEKGFSPSSFDFSERVVRNL